MRVVLPLIAAVLVVAVLAISASVAAAAVYGLLIGGRRLLRWQRAQAAAAAHQRAELLARAEIQHRWYLASDPRGTYGRYTPTVSLRRMALRVQGW
jgi:type II secretory pathway pseudopilin PulG